MIETAGPYRSPVCSFTDEGLAEFRAWLDRAEAAEVKRYTLEPPPIHLLFDERYAKPVGFGEAIIQRKFDRKYDLGMEVCRAIGKDNMRNLFAEPSAWAWLSLFFYESTFPLKKGKWFTGDRSRHLVQTIEGRTQDMSHRHLVKGAATNVYRFGPYAAVLMSEAHGQSKIEEQVMSRRADQPLAFLPEFVKALYKLYWNADTNALKSGARSDGPGSVMHLIDLLTQLDLTYDISHLKMDQLLGLLPHAFQRFFGKRREPIPASEAIASSPPSS